ncbi:hypothetical protein RND71_030099 [Anisodus tanguticus]|uniref:protein-serine/threonine phosphatase n=1 Tax=Anisodus tanguticus TaxID=243964 RepID=A0AAE1V569_9SOLA|nr:hypothetical protein RND71_030099 [Anisodus tanguticus]
MQIASPTSNSIEKAYEAGQEDFIFFVIFGRGNRPGARLVEMTNPLLVSPVVGSMSIKGRRRTMEDKVVIRQKLCSPEINRRRHVDFYAIYDGHGGHHVSALCSQRMHVVVEEELMRVRNNTYMSGSSSSSSSSGGNGSQQEWEAAWKRMLRMCFLRMDRMSSYTCDCGSLGYPCGCPPAYTLRLTGSTAVVAILTQESIIVANCGDSRAVLSRAGRAVPLSCDHKPDKLSERARIEAYGGKVIFAGVPRVGGVLAKYVHVRSHDMKK